MRFVIDEVLRAPDQWKAVPAFAELDADTAAEVLAQAGRFAADGIEHKVGILVSANSAMRHDGVTGLLVGELHGGLPAMFLAMNQSGRGPEAS